MIDTDNSETITFDELKDGLNRVGSELMESDIKALMDAADVDNNGTIDYGEFLAATMHLNKMEREENLISAFAFFEKDGSGYITVDELQQACQEFSLVEVHLNEMIKEIDQDNVGFDTLYLSRIDYQDREKRKGQKSLEVVWQGSRTLGSSAQIFTGIFPTQYDPPKGFYFDINDDSLIVQDDVLLFDYNVQQRVDDFVYQAVLQV